MADSCPIFQQHAGFVNDKAVSIAHDGEKGVAFQTKKAKSVHQPAQAGNKTSFSRHNRKYVEAPTRGTCEAAEAGRGC